MRFRTPSFWYRTSPTLASSLFLPFSKVTGHFARQRQKRPSLRVPVPVICCGNISVGGTGKTPLALYLLRKLQDRGMNPHAITRGYGGRSGRTIHVNPERDNALEVGDEAMLLAHLAPTWRGPDRKANAVQAIRNGADCLLLDDGLQDPSLHKDLSFLIIDGPVGFGNQRLLPAGPLRESLSAALPRLDAAVIFGNDRHGLLRQLAPSLPVLEGWLSPGASITRLRGQQVIAFAGIGRPQKFFTTLHDAGLNVMRTFAFPDHHLYREKELHSLARLAHTQKAILVTTEKDMVKLPPLFRRLVKSIAIEPRWHDPAMLDRLLDRRLSC